MATETLHNPPSDSQRRSKWDELADELLTALESLAQGEGYDATPNYCHHLRERTRVKADSIKKMRIQDGV